MPLARMMLSRSQRCSSNRRTCGSPRLSRVGCTGMFMDSSTVLSAGARPAAHWPAFLSAYQLGRHDFISIADVAVDLLADDTISDRGEILDQRRVDRLELGQQHGLDEAARRFHDQGLAVHAWIAIRPQAVAAGEREQELPRPGVVDGGGD